MTIEVGDVVILKSGGETMTVQEVDGTDISCVWMIKGEVKAATFDSRLLKLIPTAGGAS
ncbi:YodC family protein [Variovorax paradoxus]|uniref:YodC family protein n=1 Tax=Variovorax paradoxus TaxID=34073 RepID=UPI0024808C84|nr:DUF2158 domain-containing protein [Variovorax paradoxus]WGT63042.1 DUF2158 domain-containing protein [Variovorax paradoxus]